MQTLAGASIWAMGWNMLYNSQSAEGDGKFVYDMEVGGEQSAYVETETGSELLITITEVNELVEKSPINRKRSSIGQQKRRYIINGSFPLLWDASYEITVNEQQITKAYEPSISAFAGTVLQRKLIKESSNKRSRLEFKVSPFIGSDRSGKLISTIHGNQLVITL